MNKPFFPTEYKGKTKIVEQYLILGDEMCEQKHYNIFDMGMNAIAKEKIKIVKEEGYNGFSVFDDLDYQFLNSFRNLNNIYKSKKVFLYSEVISKKRTKVIISIRSSGNLKFWLNNECLSLRWNYITTTLNKGTNTILLEQYSPDPNTYFNIQILNYNFEMSNDVRALAQLGSMINYKSISIISDDGFYLPTKKYCNLLFMANDRSILKNDECEIEISDSLIGTVDTFKARLYQIIQIDLDKIRKLSNNGLRHEAIYCHITDKYNNSITEGVALFVTDCTKEKSEILPKAINYAKEMDRDFSDQIKGKLSDIQYAKIEGNLVTQYIRTFQINEMIVLYESGTYKSGPPLVEGVYEYYIKSELDETYIMIILRIPRNYNKDKSYPMIMNLSTWNVTENAFQFPEDKVNEPVIYVDVTGRGFAGGSYVSEASTFEVFKWIKSNYRIDENRIYLAGQSNGGYATWAIAQNHPHFWASIYPHIGYPYIKNIENISNIPTFEFVSPKDNVFAGRENEIKNKIYKYGNYHQIDFKEMTHGHFDQYIMSPIIFNNMLQYKRNKYPAKIIFRTERNRHLESYWIKLHGIKYGKNYSKIRAQIHENNNITIDTINTKGITIQIPPQLNRENFCITINRNNFIFQNNFTNELIFIYKNKWMLAEKEPMHVDYRKGTGILDIYLNKLRIIIPNNSSEIIKSAAKSISNPKSNGIDPIIHAFYPIYDEDQIPDHILENNLVLFDYNSNSQIYNRIKDIFPIKTNDDGFIYQGKNYCGKYCVMQIAGNPYNPKLSILHIGFNDEKLLRTNLFIRRMILPYYANGFHPFLNNEGLILFDNKYYVVYEWKDKIKEVELSSI